MRHLPYLRHHFLESAALSHIANRHTAPIHAACVARDGRGVLLCGDSREDKRAAAGLIELITGLRCVDCGRLEMARVTESLTALLIAVNARYKVHAGVRLTGLPEELWG